jgi:hypothetical protein
MKKILSVIIFLTGIGYSTQVNSDTKYNFVCHYAGYKGPGTVAVNSASNLAMQRVTQILNIVGLEKNFTVNAANVDNASALVQGSKRYILYNPTFMQSVRNAAGYDWTSYSILAHEIGHHLNGHTLQAGGSRPNIELEADEFSGFVLNKMGASLPEAQAAMRIIANPHGSSTHPGKNLRLKAIEKGWLKAKDQKRYS